uniref:Uncharacterized protein n=1 Tax=Anguilla anguilla TaxID=7936 RepID=A0A0E9W9N5_ANGAN
MGQLSDHQPLLDEDEALSGGSSQLILVHHCLNLKRSSHTSVLLKMQQNVYPC